MVDNKSASHAVARATPHVALDESVYPEMRFGGFSRVDGTVVFFTRVQALLGNSNTVLDVGCGRGARQDDPCVLHRQLTDLRGPERTVIGLDVSDAGWENPFIDAFRPIAESGHWPVDSSSVDVAVSDYVIEHLEDPELFFDEVHRVLRPGGFFCARTPNKWGYVAVVSRLLAQKKHARLLARVQSDRKEADVFPTVYRCNTPAAIRRVLHHAKMEGVVLSIEGEPNYLTFNPHLYRFAARLHRILPAPLRSTLLIFAQKG